MTAARVFNNRMSKKKPAHPRAYGRQADGKTIKSISLNADVAKWAEKEAKARKMSFSAFVEAVLNGTITMGVIFAILYALVS